MTTTITCYLYSEIKDGRNGKYQVLHPIHPKNERFAVADKYGETRYLDCILDSQQLAVFNFGDAVPAPNFTTAMNTQKKMELTKQQLLDLYEVTVGCNDRGFLQLVSCKVSQPAETDQWPEPEFTGGTFDRLKQRIEWKKSVANAIAAGKTQVD